MPGYCTDGSCLGASSLQSRVSAIFPSGVHLLSLRLRHCLRASLRVRRHSRLSSTAKWQDDFVYTKLYLALPFSMSNLRTDCQQVRAAEVSAGSVQMTVRRSAGGEAVKGSVRSAWYAELNFISAFGVEVALADEAECIGVKGRKCENGFEFRIRCRGVSRGYSLPACVSTAPSGNRNGGGNAAGHTRIVPQFGPSMLSCVSPFYPKKR